MQRDIAQLQDLVRSLQSSFDQKMAVIQTLAQQALDASNKANTSVTVLSAGVSSSLERTLGQALTPIAGLGAKIDSTNSDVSELRNNVHDVNESVNRTLQIVSDLLNQVKTMQVSAAVPPGGAPATNGGAAPPADALLISAERDYNGGNLDLAASEYSDFLKYYGTLPNAGRAQLNLGMTHYAQKKYDLAAADFDAAVGRNPDDAAIAPQALFMKGMSLKDTNRTEAARAWQTVRTRFPQSSAAADAAEQLRAIRAPLKP
jgi:TolA-binding protein